MKRSKTHMVQLSLRTTPKMASAGANVLWVINEDPQLCSELSFYIETALKLRMQFHVDRRSDGNFHYGLGVNGLMKGQQLLSTGMEGQCCHSACYLFSILTMQPRKEESCHCHLPYSNTVNARKNHILGLAYCTENSALCLHTVVFKHTNRDTWYNWASSAAQNI